MLRMWAVLLRGAAVLSGFSSTGAETRFNFENCGVLATDKSGNPLKYGVLGLNLKDSASVGCSVINSFAYCEGMAWHYYLGRNSKLI